MKTVGIIGGLGPKTTAKFYLHIISSIHEKNWIQRPPILISSVPLPYKLERDAILHSTSLEKILPLLVKEAKRLETAGADFIVMPCNSLHLFIEKIRKAIDIPMLSVVEETVRFIQKNKFRKVGIIATSITIENRLYEEALQKDSIDYEIPTNRQQEKIGKIIYHLVSGQERSEDEEILIAVINDLKRRGVDAVALACTDLQLLNLNCTGVKIFDTMEILADAVVREMVSI